MAAAETTANSSVTATVRSEALSLRDLLKFEFLFFSRAQFEKDLTKRGTADRVGGRHAKPAAAADVWRLESADVLLSPPGASGHLRY